MTQNDERLARVEASETWPEVDDPFEALHRRFFGSGSFWPFGAWVAFSPDRGRSLRPARTDVTDSGAAYTITAEIPGVPKEKLEIRIRGPSVEIRAESEEEKSEAAGEYVHRERSYQGFYRSLELPEPVQGTEAKAKVVDGVLVLTVPKLSPTPSPAEVRVKVE